MSITLYSHPDCLEHNPGYGHPENSGRLNAVLTSLKHSPFAKDLSFQGAPLGTQEQILLAHSSQHFDYILESAPASGQQALDGDTVMSPGSLNAALRGVGASCTAVDKLLSHEIDSAFCATRPPGHHSTHNQAMGFCIFNNAAIAALYAQQQYDLDRVAIVDFDVHHGNGTEDIMRGKQGILYISTHQSPLYPGTGHEADNIDGNILNIPLPAETDDETYQRIFTEKALPALQAFKPELLIVSAGFDAHRDDPLAGLALTEASYSWLATQLKSVADEHCEGKLLAVLEGGYNLDVLGSSVVAFVAELASDAAIL